MDAFDNQAVQQSVLEKRFKKKRQEKNVRYCVWATEPLMITCRGAQIRRRTLENIVADLFDLGLRIRSGRVMERQSRRPTTAH